MTDRQAGDLSLTAEQRERLYEANLKLAESQRKIYERRREEERDRMADMQKHADKYSSAKSRCAVKGTTRHPAKADLWDANRQKASAQTITAAIAVHASAAPATDRSI